MISMSMSKEQAATAQLMCFLRKWDEGNYTVRCRMLRTFLDQNSGKTSPELELEFSQAASLFLARLTAWLRLTYMFGTCLNLQLKAIGVFLSAACNHNYLMEFLEVGGVKTLQEILDQEQIRAEGKVEALRLLQLVSNAGRKYKEFIINCDGVRSVSECLAKSSAEETLQTASGLLESLAHGNYSYQRQVYKSLITLLTCTSPKAQQLVLQTLHTVQSIVKTADPCIVEPLLNLLQSFHLEVQYEAIELIIELLQTEVRTTLTCGVVSLLKPVRKGSHKHKILEDPNVMNMTDSLPLFVQQAAAAKALRTMAQRRPDIHEELINLGVVHNLLCAMGNKEHAESQRQASLTLEYFVRLYPVVEEHVRRAMGLALFDSFTQDAELLYTNMDDVQVDILLSNKVNITKELEANNEES